MARIRSIKPEFPQSESVGALSRDARLLFIQLWTIVDDEGRARAASRMLASLLYPYDDDAPTLIDVWLAELEERKCIRRYDVDGARYLEICKWLKHQKIDKPSKSRLPPPPDNSESPREPSRTLAPDLGPRTLDQDLGEDQDSSAAARAGESEEVKARVAIVKIFEAAKQLSPDTGRVSVWKAQGWDLKLCVEAIRERVRPGMRISTLAFFDERIREAHEKRNPTPTAKPAIVWDTIVTIWAKGVPENDAFWPPRLGPSPGEAGCRCPPEILRKHGVDPATGKLVETAA